MKISGWGWWWGGQSKPRPLGRRHSLPVGDVGLVVPVLPTLQRVDIRVHAGLAAGHRTRHGDARDARGGWWGRDGRPETWTEPPPTPPPRDDERTGDVTPPDCQERPNRCRRISEAGLPCRGCTQERAGHQACEAETKHTPEGPPRRGRDERRCEKGQFNICGSGGPSVETSPEESDGLPNAQPGVGGSPRWSNYEVNSRLNGGEEGGGDPRRQVGS